MNVWEIIFGWNDGRMQEPKKDGTYYVAVHRYGGLLDIDTVNYTTEHGWNSTPDDGGKHAIKYDKQFWWTPAVRITIEEATL